MPIHPFSAAHRICAKGDWKVTNLVLQKVLYLAHMFFMGQNGGTRLIDGHFEAWDYGPVEPIIYHKVKIFGDRPIQDILWSAPIEGTRESNILDEAADALLGKKPGELVALTHWERGAWAANYVAGIKGIIIPDRDILREYQARVTG